MTHTTFLHGAMRNGKIQTHVYEYIEQRSYITFSFYYTHIGLKMAQYAVNVLLSNVYDEKKNDPKDWWISEKLDGCRAYWSGTEFYSKQGNKFHAPAFFTSTMPAIALDGELWCGRGLFQKTTSIILQKNKNKMDNWKYVKYLAFDAPAYPGPYEGRVAYLQKELRAIKGQTYAVAVNIEKCKGKDHLDYLLKQVLSSGGEGLMLRQPNSLYEWKRSKTLLKCKLFTTNDALVLSIKKGHGRLANMMGELECELKNGIRFILGVGFSDKQRQNPPAVNSIVEFKYQELTDSGKPRFASFLRIRCDLDWNNMPQTRKSSSLLGHIQKIKTSLSTAKPSILFSDTVTNDNENGVNVIVEDDTSDDEVEEEIQSSTSNTPHIPQLQNASLAPVLVLEPDRAQLLYVPYTGQKLICELIAPCSRTASEHYKLFSHT